MSAESHHLNTTYITLGGNTNSARTADETADFFAPCDSPDTNNIAQRLALKTQALMTEYSVMSTHFQEQAVPIHLNEALCCASGKNLFMAQCLCCHGDNT